MSRLIDADTVVAMTATCPKEMDIDSFIEGMGVVLDRVYDAPTVDAVEVVRCGECKFYNGCTDHQGICMNRYMDGFIVPDWYCADGEREDDGNEQRQ